MLLLFRSDAAQTHGNLWLHLLGGVYPLQQIDAAALHLFQVYMQTLPTVSPRLESAGALGEGPAQGEDLLLQPRDMRRCLSGNPQ